MWENFGNRIIGYKPPPEKHHHHKHHHYERRSPARDWVYVRPFKMLQGNERKAA
jgi:hypothetical protein